jgi:hypothetical protein
MASSGLAQSGTESQEREPASEMTPALDSY